MSKRKGNHWKAGPEKPRTPFCWACSRRFHGRVHARIKMHSDDAEHDVHKNCAAQLVPGTFTVVYESSTSASPPTTRGSNR